MSSFAIDQDLDGAWLDDIARTLGLEVPKVMRKESAALPLGGAIAGAAPALMSLFGHYAD